MVLGREIWMLEFLWEMRQQDQIAELSLKADRAENDARESRFSTDEHQRRLDTMALTVMAMWSIMQDRYGVMEHELVNRMQEIDLRDGKADGKVAPTMSAKCESCRRSMSTRHVKCIYCGGRPIGGKSVHGL